MNNLYIPQKVQNKDGEIKILYLVQGNEESLINPTQHIDLIGAYRPDMREVDDAALQKSRVFVDSYATTMGHIGELKIPLETGAIKADHVLAEYYEPAAFKRRSDDEITLFKNGGGAHLDLMTSRYILDVWKARNG